MYIYDAPKILNYPPDSPCIKKIKLEKRGKAPYMCTSKILTFPLESPCICSSISNYKRDIRITGEQEAVQFDTNCP